MLTRTDSQIGDVSPRHRLLVEDGRASIPRRVVLTVPVAQQAEAPGQGDRSPAAKLAGHRKSSALRRSWRWVGVVELLADLSVHCGMHVTAVRARPQAREQAQPVLGGAAGSRGQHQ